MIKTEKYFDNREISNEYYQNYKMPSYLLNSLPEDKEAFILDIGCGYGQVLADLKKRGYKNIKGIDILHEAVKNVNAMKIAAEKIDDLIDFCKQSTQLYDFIIMSHVLEHIEKEKIIEVLSLIKNKLLKQKGSLLIVVPNAQSNTGVYWAYEDFTHMLLFTAGSVLFVLRTAGFKSIKFLDAKGVADSSLIKKTIKLFFLKIYELKIKFWNGVTSSFYHKPSPIIFTFDLKALTINE